MYTSMHTLACIHVCTSFSIEMGQISLVNELFKWLLEKCS